MGLPPPHPMGRVHGQKSLTACCCYLQVCTSCIVDQQPVQCPINTDHQREYQQQGSILNTALATMIRDTTCPHHPGERVWLYCADDSTAMCNTCWILDHKDHSRPLHIDQAKEELAKAQEKLARFANPFARLLKAGVVSDDLTTQLAIYGPHLYVAEAGEDSNKVLILDKNTLKAAFPQQPDSSSLEEEEDSDSSSTEEKGVGESSKAPLFGFKEGSRHYYAEGWTCSGVAVDESRLFVVFRKKREMWAFDKRSGVRAWRCAVGCYKGAHTRKTTYEEYEDPTQQVVLDDA